MRLPTRAIDIKVLKDLEAPVVRDRLSPNGQERGRLIYRSAGACPPRSQDPREKRTPTNFSPIEAWRGTGPRPTVTTL